jgi:Flp pilus assembly protein TadG
MGATMQAGFRRLISDSRGVAAVEFAMLGLVLIGLLLPISDLGIAALKYMTAYQNVRDMGAYAQYHTGAINTATTPWTVTLPAISGYTGTVQVMCGTTSTLCANTATVPKWFVFSTSFTVTPIFVTALAGTYTVQYSERFQ